MKKLIYTLAVVAGITIVAGNEQNQSLEKQVEWGLDYDCSGGHSDGRVINGLTRAEDCHDGYFEIYYAKNTVYLHPDSLPTKEHFRYLLNKSQNHNLRYVKN